MIYHPKSYAYVIIIIKVLIQRPITRDFIEAPKDLAYGLDLFN